MNSVTPETRPDYRRALDRRPWIVHREAAATCKVLFPKWLREREGIIVYQNQTLDSSHLGETAYMPARFIAQEDDHLHWAPLENRPNGGLPSLRQQQVDLIVLADYATADVDGVIAKAFRFEE